MTDRRMTATEMLEKLVSFDTVSANSNLALIDFVADYLTGHGITGRRSFGHDRTKANLIASVGPALPGGVVLSGHTDVVPVAGQPWSSDPFRVVTRDGRLYGRGTSDMKGFIAAALALLPEMRARDLRVPIHFALSFDEEVGCLGAPILLADLAGTVPPPALAIVGEPTSLAIGDRHKGFYGFVTVVSGRDGHSSATHRGVNAVMVAAEIIAFLGRVAAGFRESGPFDEGFDPPYTTLNVGTIEGGTALNIIARQCRFQWEFRPVPGFDPALITDRLRAFVETDLLPRVRQVAPETEIAVATQSAVPGLRADPDSVALALLRRLTGANRTVGLAFGTEAGLFQEAGIPAVVCGPGSIEQAHQPDEFIAVEQLDAGTALLRRVVDWAAAPA